MTTLRLDAGTRWPSLDVVPSGPKARISARVARRIFNAATSRIGVSVAYDGSGFETGASAPSSTSGTSEPTIVLHRPEEFFLRVGNDGLIGFGEAYLTGAWDSPDLCRLLTTLATELPTLVPDSLQRLRRLHVPRPPRAHRTTVDRTQALIAHHYDLSNDLFALFLDRTMSYSSALFDTQLTSAGDHLVASPPGHVSPADFEDAQARKVERLLDQAEVGAGTRVLEIGTGWGELAIRAARRGATVRTITLSAEQQAVARRRIADAGCEDRVTVDLLDYRLVEGEYDAIVSVEMIEAVGHAYWPAYFRKLDELLAPGGRVAIQAITMPHDRMLATRGGYTWINKYIFPGGFLPSVRAIEEVTAKQTTLRVTDRLSFGSHYAETLRLWDDAFMGASDAVAELGFDEIFRRMWHFYLVYSRAGFASAYLDVQQLTLTRDPR
jgi:cyclopropane-fatty-acyl-phospholipid synthase